MLPPFQGTDRGGWVSGTANLLWRQADLIREHAADALVVVSSDAVYKLDYRDVVESHLGSGAEVTMVTTEVEADDAARYGIVQVDGERVTDYAYKPDQPATTTATNEVFVFTPGATLDRLDALNDELGEDELEDLGSHLLPAQTRDGLARAHPLQGYWRDVGTVPAYWQAHRDFLDAEPPIDLDDPAWPLHTRGGRRSAARVLPGAVVEESLVSGGTRVAGEVRGSVLSPGVEVEKGPPSSTRCCCPACGCGPAPAWCAPSSTTRSRSGSARSWAVTARSPWSGGVRGWTPAASWPRSAAARARGGLNPRRTEPEEDRARSGGSASSSIQTRRRSPRLRTSAMAATRRRCSGVATWLTTAISASRIARSAATSAGVDGNDSGGSTSSVVGRA
ncbi:sugar phosphate nucleotidyltransferase [Blastococcus brunescens]|uniref:Sugar phosphate nucleotidyltransferase n=1 Tax=Blastococcus brunescens TaxID=1564165 RepID=A0ABZ1B545_9ACTN|nr:sugar phosphate nucleotidyltransferase [Blastococcus sp. BMG 8361]WRL64504.1 sugar phosphate nucleotidyltransferase [Blastococcus sp. BMG 8361]